IAAQVGQRSEGGQLRRDLINAARRNDLVGERSTAAAISSARQRVVDLVALPLHVAALDGSGGNGSDQERGLAVVGLCEAAEIEQLVFLNRSTDGAAEIVIDELGLRMAEGQKERPGVQMLVIVVLEDGSVDGVRAALRPHVNRRAARQPRL